MKSKVESKICKKCGYCEECGRGGHAYYPWYVYPYQPPYPYWGTTTIKSGPTWSTQSGTTNQSSISINSAVN